MADPHETRPTEPRDPLGIDGGPGRIFAADVRLALASTDALGKLRHELYEALGPNLSHEILFRFGFHDGSRTAIAVQKRMPDATRREVLVAGPVVHQIRGMARVGVDRLRFDDEFESIEGRWEDSFEADHSLSTLGVVEWTVCWILTGFASGYASQALDRDIVAIESTCRGRGDDDCRFELRPAERFPGMAQKVRALRAGVELKDRLEPDLARMWEKAFTSANYLARILLDSADAIVTVGPDDVIKSWNRGAEELFGYSAEEVVGRHYRFLVPEDLLVKGEIEAFRRELLETGSLRNHETRRIRKDGEEVHISLTRTAVSDEQGRYAGASVIARDITETRRLAQELAQAKRLAEVGEFAAHVAHEIKNPLAGISAAIQLLSSRTEEDHPEQVIYREVLNHVDRLDGTVRALLEYTRPYRPSKEPVPLGLLVDSAVSMTGDAWGHLPLVVRREIEPGAEQVVADPQQMVQVLLNLFLNAAQAAEGDPEILVRGRVEGGESVLEVADLGPGIPPDVLGRLFRPFFTTKQGGNGLGLPIARKIIESHGGRITVESEAGHGTTVRIRLPL